MDRKERLLVRTRHVRERAKERFNLTLEYSDVRNIEGNLAAFRKNSSGSHAASTVVLNIKKTEVYAPRGVAYAVKHKGIWLPVIFLIEVGVVATILPEWTLPRILRRENRAKRIAASK